MQQSAVDGTWVENRGPGALMPRPPGRRRRTRGLIVSHRGYRWHLFCAPLAFSARGSHTPLLHLGRYIASSAALWRLEMVRYRQPARLLSFVACLRAARLARESHFARRDEKERGAATGTRYTRTQQACARLCIIPYRSLYSRVRHAYAHSKLLLLFGDAKRQPASAPSSSQCYTAQ
jgi:hypothetical protein